MAYNKENCVAYFKNKYSYMEEADIELLYEISCDLYINYKYPFAEVYEVSEKDLKKHPTWFLRCMQELIDKEGISNVVGYSENGVSITFDKTGLSQSLIDEIIGEAGVI